MKRKLLFAALCAVMSIGYSYAYTTSDLTSAGWTKITSISQSDIANNYYIFLSENEDLILGLAESTNQSSQAAFYQKLSDPAADGFKVWTLEANGSNYGMRNLKWNSRQMQTEWSGSSNDLRWRTNDQTGSIRWTGLSLTPDAEMPNGKWTLTSTEYNRPLGIYNNVTGTPVEGNEVGANDSDKGQKFNIYSISKAAYWRLLAATATDANPIDFTGWISNPEIYNGNKEKLPNGWSEEDERSAGNNNRTAGTGKTVLEGWSGAALKVGYYQAISGLPKAKYKLTAETGDSNGTGGGIIYITGTTEQSADMSNTTEDITTSAVESDGSLTIGMKADGSNSWVHATNFRLYLVDPYISYLVTDIQPATATALTSNAWYKFIPASTGNYTIEATTVGDIIYTTDDQLLSSATGTTASGTIELTAGTTYYMKSASSQTVTLSPQAYTYTIGSATTDISYVQGGETVTVTYEDMTTDNPSPTIATPALSGITFADESISCTATADNKGFTFVVPNNVTANSTYTLSIPAGAIGYSDGEGTLNAAQNITITSPALFNGNYYFRVASTYNGSTTGTSAAVGKYLSRGGSYGTHTTVDRYGQAITVTTDGHNVTTLKLMDSQAYIYHAASWESWADAGSTGDNTAHSIILTDGGYRISSNQNTGKYFKYNNGDVNKELIPIYDDGTGANNGPIINWAVEAISDHATAMQALKDKQAAAAAAAAYSSGDYALLNGITTVSALETELTSNYIEGTFVSASEINSVQESYQPRAGKDATEPVTVYSNTINITEPGFYKFSMQAFFRSSDNAKLQAIRATGADMPSAALFFGDSETQIKSVYDEPSDEALTTETSWINLQWDDKYYPNDVTTSLAAFKAGKYHNDVWFYASAAGEYTYGVKVMGYANSQWFIYSPESVTVTSYAAAADDADYTALAAAITTYDEATWGFEKDQYAPYNNVEARSNIAAAKAIDKEVTNSKLLVNSLTTKLALSANATDVDAIYNGLFATVATGQNYPDGWTRSNGWGQMQSGISGNFATAYYNQPGSLQYGNQGVYTMPLEANQHYKLTFSYRSHENGSNTGVTASVLNGEDGLAATEFDGNGSNSEWKTVSAIVNTVAAGDYVLTLANSGNTWMTNVSLVKATEVTANMTVKAGKFGTFIAPFDVTIPAGIKAYTIGSIEESKLNLTEVETTIPANTPVILKNTTAAEYNDDFTGYSIATEDSYTANYLTGVYTDATIAASDGSNTRYVLQTQGDVQAFYTVDADFTATANRCYLTVPVTAGVKAFYLDIDGSATAIDEIANGKSSDGKWYNLAGQRVNKAQKGIYIVNGKKVAVK